MLAFGLYKFILLPSYLSFASVCVVNGDQIVEDNGFEVVGFTTQLSDGNISITLLDEDIRTLKHELVHVKQINLGRPLECSKPIRYFFGEFGANVWSYLPKFVFERTYGEI